MNWQYGGKAIINCRNIKGIKDNIDFGKNLLNIMQFSESEIIENIKKGNLDCFQQIFDTYYENLCQYAFTILRDMDEAEDIVQSMFLRIWEKRESLNITNSIRSYIYRAVHNQCLNQIEHRTIRQRYIEYNVQSAFSGEQLPDVFPQELEENIVAIISQLPKQCRIIFMMSRYEELKYSEISQKLGISVNTVENQISKALKILRAKLKEMFV